MNLTDENIIQLLIEYVTDKRYKQAILIDGDWGSGKTYFIQEKLISSLEGIAKENSEQKQNVIYVSLYGVEKFSQIIDDIYATSLEVFFDNKLGDGKGEKIGKGINFASQLFTAGIKYFNIDKDDLPKISDLKKIKDAVIIFDDLERCSVDINQLLGFINNLVEHNEIKIIIVANQTEIGKSKFLNDIERKYSVVLNPQLKLEDLNKENSRNQDNDNKQLDMEELQKYTENLFSEDIMYERVKEKLIGLTINYRANIDNIYEEIIDKYINDESAKKELVEKKELVIEIFKKRQHNNIRTLIFSLMAFEKIFCVVNEIAFKPQKFIEEQLHKILNYILEVSIQIKTGQPVFTWSNSTAQTGTVHLEKNSMWGESIFGYRFVDKYLTTRFLDIEEVKSVILGIVNEDKKVEEERAATNELSYFNICGGWWYLEDDEIICLLKKMQSELQNKKYHPRYFKDIIVLLMQLQYAGFTPFDFQQMSNDFVCYMQQRLEENEDDFKAERLEVLSDNQEFIDKYNLITKPLFDTLHRKVREEKEKINCSLDLESSWGHFFQEKCKENRESYIMENKFMFYITPEKVVEKLKTSSVKDIYEFLDGIKNVYSFSNLNDFFKDDIENLTIIISELNINELSEGKTTKRLAIEKLKEKLEQSLVEIQR